MCCNHSFCLPPQINCPSLEQELFNRLLFPGFHHTTVLPAQQDCVWYGSWYNCCQALQDQMTQKNPEESPTLILSRHCVCVFLKMLAELGHPHFKGIVRTRRSIKMVAESLMHISMNNFSSLLLGFVSDTYCISACISTCCFQILFLCQILLKTGIMTVYATFSLTQHLPLFKY